MHKLNIMCAQCGKPVERVDVYEYPDGDVRIVVTCHGQTESMELTFGDQLRLGPEYLKQVTDGQGVAFTNALQSNNHT